MLRCRECKETYCDVKGDENHKTGYCFRCFEAGFEEWEDRRRERLAERNEY